MLAEHGCAVRLVSHAPSAEPLVDLHGLEAELVRRENLRQLIRPNTSAFARALSSSVEGGTVIHDHGIWLPMNHAAASVATTVKVPRIVSVRGMLTEWSLGQSRWKKRLMWTMLQRRDLETAACIHATSEEERGDVRRKGLRVPVAIIPNGVDVPAALPAPVRPARKRALFLGRIHPIKGLEDLLDAWQGARQAGWELVVAGPIEDARLGDRLEAVTAADSSIRYVGEVADAAKWELYASADLFVLPTRSENFGIVVAEALAAGVPVITTKGAPWQELETHRCGWWIDHGVEPLVEALSHAMTLPDEERREMGKRGRALVEENYSWETVAEKMIEVYEWMLGRSAAPDCVEM